MGAFMKIDRLLGITIHLLNHDKSSAKILASKFEVSLRTIQRDIESLCQAGIPVVSYVGAEGGYKILESFKMDRQIAGDVDYQYIILALQGLASAYENPKVETTLEKMKAIEYLNGSIESEYENGDFIMNLHLPESEQLWLGTLLSLGNLVKAIEPEELKNRLCSKCIDIINLYT
jgi:predicted DNA-binding transcriptional regulator YafY